MGRTSYALMSLAAAVPAAILALILVGGFLQHADNMPGLLTVVAGLTWLIAVLVAVTPVGILLFGGDRSARRQKGTKAAAVASPSDRRVADEMEAEEGFLPDEPLSDEVGLTSDDEWESESAVDFAESEGDEFEFDDSQAEFDEDFDFDDDAQR